MRRNLTALASLTVMVGAVLGQDVRQWDFDNGDLSATLGGDALTFQNTQGSSEFGTTTDLGIADINGEEAAVLQVPKTTFGDGYGFPSGIGNHDSWTLIMDIYYPADSSGKNRGVLDLFGSVPGAEFGLDTANTLTHLGRGAGTVRPDTWHRIAWVTDFASFQVRKFVDGRLVGSGNVTDLDFDGGRLTIDSSSLLFSDDSDGAVAQTEVGYVNSIQFRAEVLSNEQMIALGGPSAAGIPQELPAVPSFIVEFTPRGDVAPLNTDLGAVINQGNATIDQSSIEVSIDGTALSPTVTQDGNVLTVVASPAAPFGVGTSHTMTLSYTDDADGLKTFTRTFTAALFFQDFEGLELEASVDEGLAAEAVWTRDNGPEGWVVDDSGVPGAGDPENDGVTEWAGWSFANKDWWVETAGDQDRSQFSRGVGNVAIADPDEWDDAGHADSEENGWYETIMKTPEIDLTGIDANSLFLKFDSSWRPEFDSNYHQSAEITVSFDGGDPQQILLWLSDSSSPNFKAAATNESVIIDLENPAGASSLVVNFRMFDAGNDWWWAVDNVTVNAGAKPPTVVSSPDNQSVKEGAAVTLEVIADGADTYQWFLNDEAIDGATASTYMIAAAGADDAGTYVAEVSNSAGSERSNPANLEVVIEPDLGGVVFFSEDFEGLPLGPNVDEGVPGDMVWTKTAPEGWTVDDSGVPGAGDPENDGVTEWAGWGFATRAWWAETAGDQRRSEFLRGTGTIAIADGDEWDDAPREAGTMDTLLISPEIDIEGVVAGSMNLRFDSSWRPENAQTATVTVAFDGGEPIEVVRFDSDGASANFKDHAPNDTIFASIDNPEGASRMVLAFRYFDAGNNWWWAVDNIAVSGEVPAVFFEDFESVNLGPNVDEAVAGDAVWTKEPPAGWNIDDSGVPGAGDPENDGVTEWAGWSFASRAWWAETAGDQRRSEFLRGQGAIAIADGDEWDDLPRAAGTMNTFLSSPSIDISGEAANTLFLNFDSSWRPENDQKANVTVSYDGADAVEVLLFDTASTTDAPNEGVSIPLRNPAGASSMVLTFGYFDAGNNWWWAIDNVEVVVGTASLPPVFLAQPEPLVEATTGESLALEVSAEGDLLSYQWFFGEGDDRVAIPDANDNILVLGNLGLGDAGVYSVDVTNAGGTITSNGTAVTVLLPSGPTVLLFEDFDGVPLGDSIDEENPDGGPVWTKTAPTGWGIMDDVPGQGDDAVGVREWEGWSFANTEWWAAVGGDQQRTQFTKSTGASAIADGDEWDDRGDPADLGNMDTALVTPVIPVGNVAPGSVVLRFDSSWRPDATQKGTVTVAFDGGEATELLFWDSEATENFKPDATNETVTLAIDNPAGAQSMVIAFRYFDAGNHWWWAIDNVEVSGLFEIFSENFDSLALGPNVDEALAGDAVWTKTAPAGWVIDDSLVPGAGDPENDGVTEWAGWSFADRAWWSETAGDQRRTEFTRGTGVVAVADGDEWDDLPREPGNMSTLLSTPPIDISGVPAGAGILVFDSSWRPEVQQTAVVTAAFDGGAPIEIVRFDSDPASANFKDHAPNDTIEALLQNPAGASTVVLTFGYLDAGNNWWWAIDNIRLTVATLPSGVTPPVPPLPPTGGGITSYEVNADGSITIIYTGTLSASPTVDGPYLPIPGATSPITVDPGAGADSQFYIAQ